MTRLSSKLDPWLFRRPFEGARARRYADRQRAGFDDLDERLIQRWRAELSAARTVLDLGAGPGVFAAKLAAAFAHLQVIAVEPSATYAHSRAPGRVTAVRARAEALPLADGAVDVAICLSSIRHVADRAAALRELRRVVAPAGEAYLVELDPSASRARRRRHIAHMRSWLSRLVFAPLIARTAPPAEHFAALACDAGWPRAEIRPDPIQPVYTIRLSI